MGMFFEFPLLKLGEIYKPFKFFGEIGEIRYKLIVGSLQS
jgi:hypothetical protein